MPTCLIRGVAGVGKSSLVEELKSRGQLAYDADDKHAIPGLGNWFNSDGAPVKYSPDLSWRANHEYRWNLGCLATFLEAAPNDRVLYVAGTATNDFEAVSLFNSVVLLDAGVDTICKRLVNPSRRTPYPFDCTEEYKAQLAERLPVFRQEACALGAVALDAEVGISRIADNLTAYMMTNEQANSQKVLRLC